MRKNDIDQKRKTFLAGLKRNLGYLSYKKIILEISFTIKDETVFKYLNILQ